mmetsp:Transcript_8995/g.9042  ORF Transcript_8995/g.9042 Transcript_8995/m.9042 type:complete len:1237 (+) Transcript_8995:80-3790(+)
MLRFLCGLAVVNFGSVSGAVRFGSIVPTTSHISAELRAELEADRKRSRDFILPKSQPHRVVGEAVEFELFDGEVVTGTVKKVIDRGYEGATWTGSLISAKNKHLDQENDLFTLTCYMQACVANLVLESTNSNIQMEPAVATQLSPTGHGLYRMSEYAEKLRSGTNVEKHLAPTEKRIEELEEEYDLENDSFLAPLQKQQPAVDTDSILDLGQIYTPEAVQRIGNSHAAMVAKVHLANDEANQILEDSGVSLRYRVVFVLPMLDQTFKEGGTDGTTFVNLLYHLQDPSDGVMDEAHEYREKYNADVVQVIVRASAYAGIAFVLTGYSPSYAFSGYFIDYVRGHTWAHELGHIQGCYHDRFSGSLYWDDSWKGYGNCWEDETPGAPHCKCYASVMVYDCKTEKNQCTSCTDRNYYANMNVMNADAPTGLPLASCGLHIHERRFTPISYRTSSSQKGGIISSVSPSSVWMSSCDVVTIKGWKFAHKDTITTVTLAGVEAEILSFTDDEVVVKAPSVSSPTTTAGDVVVTTDTGRISKVSEVFSFIGTESTFTSNFANGLDSTIWESTGDAYWSVSYPSILKRYGSSDPDHGQLTATGLNKEGGSNKCYDTLNHLSFEYWAYSTYSFCYDKFIVEAEDVNGVWSTVFTGVTGLDANEPPYLSASVSLPTDTRSVRFDVTTAPNTNCRYWAPVYLREVTVSKEMVCADPCTDEVVDLPSGSDPIFELKDETEFTGVSGLYYESISERLSNHMTLSMWITIDDALTTDRVLDNNAGDEFLISLGRSGAIAYEQWSLLITSEMKLSFVDYGDDSTGFGFNTATVSEGSITPGEPTHIAFVKDGTTGTFYINGIPSGKHTATHSVIYSTQDLAIGYDNKYEDAFFVGVMTDIRMFKKSFSSEEVIELFSGSSTFPSAQPSSVPSVPTMDPTSPSSIPTGFPSSKPSAPTVTPSSVPSSPTVFPTSKPSSSPVLDPTSSPISAPTLLPTSIPTQIPTSEPTMQPTLEPTISSSKPTSEPTNEPTLEPTLEPTNEPTMKLTVEPTIEPTLEPTLEPTIEPTVKPTAPNLPSTVFEMKGLNVFDGWSSGVLLRRLDPAVNNHMTISMWITTTTRNRYLMSLGRVNRNNLYYSFSLYISNRGQLKFQDYSKRNGFAPNKGFSESVVTTGRPTHIALVRHGRYAYYFVNGVYDGHFISDSWVNYRNYNFVIGYDKAYNSARFKGNMGNVKVYNEALDSNQIKVLYNMDT